MYSMYMYMYSMYVNLPHRPTNNTCVVCRPSAEPRRHICWAFTSNQRHRVYLTYIHDNYEIECWSQERRTPKRMSLQVMRSVME